jgi:hypothetical protein
MKRQLTLYFAFVALLLLALSAPVAHAAKSPAMESCSAEWKQLKDAGKVKAGQTWPKFWSKCAKDYAAAHPGAAAATQDTAGSATTTTKKAASTKTAVVDESDTTGTGAQKKECDAKWGEYKGSTGAHGWHDYFQFMAKCM